MRRFLIACAVLASARLLVAQVALRGGATVTGVSTGTVVHGLQPHPRIWLTSSVRALVAAKVVALDADWLSVKANADTAVPKPLPQCTVTGATNASPVSFTCSENTPVATTGTVLIEGATSGWTAINNTLGSNSWTATKTGTHTFTIPVNSTGFGSFSGQSISVFVLDGEPSGYLGYNQYGDGYFEALRDLALTYRFGGGSASYLTQALAIVDFINTFGATANNGPASIDSGRAAGMKTMYACAAYDWLYSQLSVGRRTALITTMNHFVTWATVGEGGSGPAFSVASPTSNYWEATNTLAAVCGYATSDDNASAAAQLAWVATNWTTNFVPTFAAPSTVTQTLNTNGQGMYYGGLTALGYNYGANDIARHARYLLAVQSATGTFPDNAVAYGQRWATGHIYETKPDRRKTVSWGTWSGSTFGLLNAPDDAILLSALLDGTTEGGWMAWLYAHATYVAPADGWTHLLFYDASRTQTDYTGTEAPYKFLDGSDATAFVRSGWGTTDDFASVRLSPVQYSASGISFDPLDMGAIDLTRGSDWLLVQSGQWHGTTDGSSGSPEVFLFGGSYSNGLYFADAPTGQCLTSVGDGSTYDGCQMLYGTYVAPRVYQSSTYTVAENEFRSAYYYTGTRTLSVFRRAFVALGDGTYLAWDRTQATASEFTRHDNWHYPATTAPTLTLGTAGTIVTTVGASKLTQTVLLPTRPTLNLVRNDSSASNYRVEVWDPAPAQAFCSLSTFQTTASGSSGAAAALLTIVDSNYVGVYIPTTTRKVVLLPNCVVGQGLVSNNDGTYGSSAFTGASWSVTHTGTATTVLYGLAPNTAFVVRQGGSSIATPTSTAIGSVTFSETGGGAFTVSPT